MNRFVLSGCAVLILVGIAGWGVSQGPYVPEIPSDRVHPGVTMDLEGHFMGDSRKRSSDVLDLLPLVRDPAPQVLDVSEEGFIFAWEPQAHSTLPGGFERCRADADGRFQGKHANGQIEFVGVAYPAFGDDGLMQEWWPMQPYRLSGERLDFPDSVALGELARVRSDGVVEVNLGYEDRAPIPQVCSLLRLDKISAPVERTFFEAVDVGTGFSPHDFHSWREQHLVWGEAELAIWHDAKIKVTFGLEHRHIQDVEFPLLRGERVEEGLVELEVLGWLEGQVELSRLQGTVATDGTVVGTEAWEVRRKPANSTVTTAVILSNFGDYAIGLEARAMVNGDWERAILEFSEEVPLLLVTVPAQAAEIQMIRIHHGWPRTGTFITAEIDAMPGTPEVNQGIRDLAQMEFPLDLESLEAGEIENLLWQYLRLNPYSGPNRPKNYDWGDARYAPAEWGNGVKAKELVRRWERLTGAKIRFEVDKGQFVLGPEPRKTWLVRQWEALEKRFRP